LGRLWRMMESLNTFEPKISTSAVPFVGEFCMLIPFQSLFHVVPGGLPGIFLI
jgi:hypothetical protein